MINKYCTEILDKNVVLTASQAKAGTMGST